MASIFISYSRKNQQEVNLLAEDLRNLWDHQVWFDVELTGGQLWWDHILQQVREAEIFLFALTPDSLGSLACRQELAYATALGRPILPVLLAESIHPAQLISPLNKINYTKCWVRDSASHAALRRAIDGLLPAPPLPARLPEPPEIPLSELEKLRERVDSKEVLDSAAQAALIFRVKQELKKAADEETRQQARALFRELLRRRDFDTAYESEIEEVLSQLGASPDGGARTTASSAAGSAYSASYSIGVGELNATLVDLISRVAERGERWRLAVDEKNFLLLLQDPKSKQQTALLAQISACTTNKQDRFLNDAGWKVGWKWKLKFGALTGAVGGLAVVTYGAAFAALLSKKFRDYASTAEWSRTWPNISDPDSAALAAQDLDLVFGKLFDDCDGIQIKREA
jgi:hypothetical protein